MLDKSKILSAVNDVAAIYPNWPEARNANAWLNLYQRYYAEVGMMAHMEIRMVVFIIMTKIYCQNHGQQYINQYGLLRIQSLRDNIQVNDNNSIDQYFFIGTDIESGSDSISGLSHLDIRIAKLLATIRACDIALTGIKIQDSLQPRELTLAEFNRYYQQFVVQPRRR